MCWENIFDIKGCVVVFNVQQGGKYIVVAIVPVISPMVAPLNYLFHQCTVIYSNDII